MEPERGPGGVGDTAYRATSFGTDLGAESSGTLKCNISGSTPKHVVDAPADFARKSSPTDGPDAFSHMTDAFSQSRPSGRIAHSTEAAPPIWLLV